MTNYLEILEIHAQGYSQRSIEAVLDCAQELNITWSIEGDVTQEMLDELFYGSRSSSAAPYAVIDFKYIHRELSKKGVTLTLLWRECCKTTYTNSEKQSENT